MVEKALKDVARQIALRSHYDNFIGGKWWRRCADRRSKPVAINGKVVSTHARSTAEDIELALDARTRRRIVGQTSPRNALGAQPHRRPHREKLSLLPR